MKQVAPLFIPLLVVIPGLTLTSFEPLAPKPPIMTAPLIENKKLASLEAFPVDSLYQLLAAEMALDRDQPEIALVNYIAAAKETQDADIAARATQIALSSASLETALIPASIWAKAAKNNLEAQITVAALYIRLDQVSKAVPYLLQGELANADEAFQYYLILFRQLQNDADKDRVIDALELLAKQETTTVSGHLALAEIYMFQGKEAKAYELSEKALKMDPHSSIGIQLVTETILRKKGKLIAKSFLDKEAEMQKQNKALQQYYAQFLIENGFNEEAAQQLKELFNDSRLTNDELMQLARMSIQARLFDMAEKILKKTSQIDETKDLSHYFLARIAEMQEREEEAIEWYKQVLTGSFHVLSQIRASSLLSEKKRFDEALEVLEHTQPTDKLEKKQIVLSIVDIYNLTKRYPQSLSLLNECIAAIPNEIDTLYARSLVADKLDRIDIAENDLKLILSLQPNHVDALNALGYMLVNKTQRFDEAQEYLLKALKISPNNASVLDSMGWLYFKRGDYHKSLDTLKKAAEITPDAEIAAHLGEVLWYLKDFDGAKKVWNNALELHPKDDQVINAMQRLIPNKGN